jgi:hypothetical protein
MGWAKTKKGRKKQSFVANSVFSYHNAGGLHRSAGLIAPSSLTLKRGRF